MQPDAFFAQVEERQRASMPYLASLECATRGDIYATSLGLPEKKPCRICGVLTVPYKTYGYVHYDCYKTYWRERRRDYFRARKRKERAS